MGHIALPTQNRKMKSTTQQFHDQLRNIYKKDLMSTSPMCLISVETSTNGSRELVRSKISSITYENNASHIAFDTIKTRCLNNTYLTAQEVLIP